MFSSSSPFCQFEGVRLLSPFSSISMLSFAFREKLLLLLSFAFCEHNFLALFLYNNLPKNILKVKSFGSRLGTEVSSVWFNWKKPKLQS